MRDPSNRQGIVCVPQVSAGQHSLVPLCDHFRAADLEMANRLAQESRLAELHLDHAKPQSRRGPNAIGIAGEPLPDPMSTSAPRSGT